MSGFALILFKTNIYFIDYVKKTFALPIPTHKGKCAPVLMGQCSNSLTTQQWYGKLQKSLQNKNHIMEIDLLGVWFW